MTEAEPGTWAWLRDMWFLGCWALYLLGIMLAVADLFSTESQRLRDGDQHFHFGGLIIAGGAALVAPGCCLLMRPTIGWGLLWAKPLDLAALLAFSLLTDWLGPIWLRDRLRRGGELGCDAETAVYLPPWQCYGPHAEQYRQAAVEAEELRLGPRPCPAPQEQHPPAD